MKRFTYILLSVLTALSVLFPLSVYAGTEELEDITTPHIILYEAESGTVLYERASREKAYPASTTKIMTCLVALEYYDDLDQTYTCGFESTNGFGSQSSLLGLQYGFTMTIRDMLYGLMLVSGNDCGACLAVATYGSIDNFVAKMNEKAAEIGMNDTHYVNAHGLQNENHYTTAYDMALLMSYALKNEDFKQIIRTKEYTVNEVNGKFSNTIYTSNKMLYTKANDTENNEYPYTIGGKTGETNTAGYTLVEAAEKNGVTLIAVLMGDNNQGGTSKYYRFQNARRLFNWGFENYVRYGTDDFNFGPEEVPGKINVYNRFNVQTVDYDEADPNRGIVEAAANVEEIMLAGVKDDIGTVAESSFSWAEPVLDEQAITAPVRAGDVLGTVKLLFNGEPLMDCELTACADVSGKKSIVIGNTDDPNAVSIVDGTSSPVKEKLCNLTISKNGGDDKYTEWVFYDNTLCTMEGGTTCYYLFYDGEVFRSSTAPADKKITLYRIVETEDGGVYYVPNAEAEDGGRYIVACGEMALKADKQGRSLAAQNLEFDEQGNLITAFSSDIIWTFTQKSSGFQLTSNGRYLHRSPGDGLLFWIIIAIAAIAVAIILRLLLGKKSRRHNVGTRRRSGHRIYRA